jgi:D-threo-aldose 1-dehydrogenase
MIPTETRKLGKSGVSLTQLGFGGAPLGELFVRVDEATAAATLQAAWDEGVRYYDTAPYYGRGLSEIRHGRFLDAKPRSEFVLSSKVGRWFFPPAKPDEFQTGPVWAGGLRFDHVHDYSYDGVMRSYEQSQMRLGMNRIDLLLIHDLDFWFHKTEAKVAAYLGQLFTSGWRALDELRSHGLVRGVGAGINELGMMPLYVDGAGRPRSGISLLRAGGRRDRHRRRLQFRNYRDGTDCGREVQLRRRDARGDGARAADRGGM